MSSSPASPAHRLLDAAYAVYRRGVSPVLHRLGFSQCIYLPTCSEYAYLAIARHGLARGTVLALGRILRCHPLAKGGFDPVP